MTIDEQIKHKVEQGIQRFQISDIYLELKDLDRKIDNKMNFIIGSVWVPIILFIISILWHK